MPGPVPNRSDDLNRPRARKGGNQQEVTKGVAREVVIPSADPTWHKIARMLWDSLTTSGQSDFYQDSDWAFAYAICDDLSYYKTPFKTKDGVEYIKRSGQFAQTLYSAMDRLLVTEADRRRVRIELEAPVEKADSAAVVAIEQYRQGLELVPDPPQEPTS